MRILFKNDTEELKKDFYHALFGKLYEQDIDSNVNSLYNLFKNRLIIFKNIYNCDLETMDDCNFSFFMNLYYDVNLDINEDIDIYNKTNNKEYEYVEEIKTSIIKEVPIFGNNKEIGESWVLTPVKISYQALIDKNSSFDINKEYSYSELSELINNKTIVLLEIIYHPTDELVSCLDTKELPVNSLNSCSSDYSIYFKEYIKKVRKELNNKRKLEDLKNYLVSYKKELDTFIYEMPYLDIQSDISDEAVGCISGSNEYDELNDMITKIK